MKTTTKRIIIVSGFLLVFFIFAICLRVNNQSPSAQKYVLGGTLTENPDIPNIDTSETSLSRQTIQVMNKRKSNLNETYFRPSQLKAVNSNFPDPKSFTGTFQNGTVPPALMDSSMNSAVNYFSVLQQASNLTVKEGGGCGTVGYALEPYPVAYSFLSENNKSSMSYEEFLKSFEGIGHINLIKINPIVTGTPDKDRYFIELEILEGTPIGVTTFNYYTGELDVIKVNGLYYIDALYLSPEDFFCAAYHGWAHNAESYVEIVYGNWCGLIMKQYAPKQDDYKKSITVDGVDGKKYMFEFAKLTNGTDLLINSLVKEDGDWVPANIDIEEYRKGQTGSN